MGGVTSDQHPESESQSSVIIIEDDAHVLEKDGCRIEGLGLISQSDGERPISNSEANMERTLYVQTHLRVRQYSIVLQQYLNLFVHDLATTSSAMDEAATRNDEVPCEQTKEHDKSTVWSEPTRLVESKEKDNELKHFTALTSLVTTNIENFNT